MKRNRQVVARRHTDRSRYQPGSGTGLRQPRRARAPRARCLYRAAMRRACLDPRGGGRPDHGRPPHRLRHRDQARQARWNIHRDRRLPRAGRSTRRARRGERQRGLIRPSLRTGRLPRSREHQHPLLAEASGRDFRRSFGHDAADRPGNHPRPSRGSGCCGARQDRRARTDPALAIDAG